MFVNIQPTQDRQHVLKDVYILKYVLQTVLDEPSECELTA